MVFSRDGVSPRRKQVRRFPLGVIALLAACVGCAGTARHEVAVTPDSALSTSFGRVTAGVVVDPARIHLASPVRVAKPLKAREPVATATQPATTRSAARHAPPYATPHAATTAATSPGAAPTADSYPYATSTTDASDAWGFTQRQCVSYAAWRLSTAGHAISNRDGWGDASNWDDAARRLGRPVSTTPFVGAIAQWDAGESSGVYASGSSTANGSFTAGPYGHVGYVTAVYADGSVAVAQYNALGDRTFSAMRMRAPRYV